MTMRKILSVALVLTMALAVSCSQQDTQPDSNPAQIAETLENLEASFVVVEYTLQKDSGDDPEAYSYAERCPNCGGYHGTSIGSAMSEERPLALSGYLISPTMVIVRNPGIPSRFIKKLQVRYGDNVTDAQAVAWASHQNAYFLKLDKALEGATPLEFDSAAEGPYFFAIHNAKDNEPTSTMAPFSPAVIIRNRSESLRGIETNGLVVNAQGTPVGMIYTSELGLDDAWKGDPMEWVRIEKDAMEAIHQRVQKAAQTAMPRVELIMRSPSSENDMYGYNRVYGGEELFSGTEANVPGIIWDSKTLLVLGDLSPDNTARLEEIRVHTNDGQVVNAKFKASLKELPILVAELEKPLDKTAIPQTSDLKELRYDLIIAASVRVVGDKREIRTRNSRIIGFEKGRKGKFFPVIPGERNIFLFNTKGELVIIPGGYRHKPWEESYYSQENVLMATAMLEERLGNLAQYTDAANVPLSKEEENRIAWLGVQLQSLDPELARANNVALETQNGRAGALVTQIYPDSPAERADIQPGSILLSLQIKGEPNPIQIVYQDQGIGFGNMFPWDRLDELPEEYFDQLPSPFPSIENSFNKILTSMGEGKSYTLNMIVNGEKVAKDLTVEMGPAHFKSAARTENNPVGINVRNVTFEVRRYVKLKEDDPGVVISKVEPGSKASVAGVKPYELLTHINGKPIHNIDEFDKAIAGPGEYKLTIKRMAKTRIVTISLADEDFKEKDTEEDSGE